MKVFCSWNGGKGNCLACYKALLEGFDVSYLLDISEYGLSETKGERGDGCS